MTVKALIFDFDGLILDTETPIYEAIRDVYRQYGFDLKLEEYTYCIGSYEDNTHFLRLLQDKLQIQLPMDQLVEQINQTTLMRIHASAALPGVSNLLQQAEAMNLPCLVASSSNLAWVDGLLRHLGLRHYFLHVCTSEDVVQVKPEPDLFLLALQRAGVKADEAIVFEDSANGILAAHRAGIFSVAVPNPMTQNLDLSKAGLILNKIDQIPLKELLNKVI